MKIVKRIDFLKLPAETLYAPYGHCYFEGLMIKGDTINDNDWCYQQIAEAIVADDSTEWADLLFNAAETGESLQMDFDCQGRDGAFEPDDRLFAVYEPKDVEYLINRLRRCLPDKPEAKPSRMSMPHTCICEICRREMAPIFIGGGIDYSDPRLTAAAAGPAPGSTSWTRNTKSSTPFPMEERSHEQP